MRRGQLVLRERLAVPVLLAGAEADAVSLDGARDDRLRLALGRFGAIERGENGGDVVAVDHFGGESLGLEFAAIDFHVVLIHGGLALAERVDVRDHGEIVELVVAGKFRRFPDLAFGHFAVAQQDVDARRTLIEPRADRESRADRKSLAERAGGGVHAGNERRGMAFEFAGKLRAASSGARSGKTPASASAA